MNRSARRILIALAVSITVSQGADVQAGCWHCQRYSYAYCDACSSDVFAPGQATVSYSVGMPTVTYPMTGVPSAAVAPMQAGGYLIAPFTTLPPALSLDVDTNRLGYARSYATCELFVAPKAVVMINGKLTRQPGQYRLYTLRCPEPGMPYKFTIQVTQGGVTRYRYVRAQAGDELSLRWTATAVDFPYVGTAPIDPAIDVLPIEVNDGGVKKPGAEGDPAGTNSVP